MAKLWFPLLAIIMAGYAAFYVVGSRRSREHSAVAAETTQKPFANAICGIGVIESETEDVAVGSPLPGIVLELYVSVGDFVQAGERLMRLDDQEQLAQLAVREAALQLEYKKLIRLKSQPRKEELPAKAEKVRECHVLVAYQSENLKRFSQLLDTQAISMSEFELAKYAVDVAEAQLATAVAEYVLLESGAWQPDCELAQAEVDLAQAELARIQSEIDRMVLKAPISGRVLQVNFRQGEFVATPSSTPVFRIGRTEKFNIRIQIDDRDIDQLRSGARAIAVSRGRRKRSLALSFVRVEPYVVPKRSLNASPAEQVDTRVLQVVYQFASIDPPLYVGQEMDVFVETDK